MNIAIADRDLTEARSMAAVLTQAGHSCQAFSSSRSLVRQMQQTCFDMAVLDWGLEGNEVLRWIRSCSPSCLPVLCTADEWAPADVVLALNAGAQGHALRPVHRELLLAHADNLLRSPWSAVSAPVEGFGDYVFDTRVRTVTLRGQPVALTYKEFHVALTLFRNLGQPLSHLELFESVWNRLPGTCNSRTLATHVSLVRSKLGLHPDNGFLLTSVYSFGYRLDRVGPQQAAPAG